MNENSVDKVDLVLETEDGDQFILVVWNADIVRQSYLKKGTKVLIIGGIKNPYNGGVIYITTKTIFMVTNGFMNLTEKTQNISETSILKEEKKDHVEEKDMLVIEDCAEESNGVEESKSEPKGKKVKKTSAPPTAPKKKKKKQPNKTFSKISKSINTKKNFSRKTAKRTIKSNKTKCNSIYIHKFNKYIK